MRVVVTVVARSWTRFASAPFSASCTACGVRSHISRKEISAPDWWAALWRKENEDSAFKADWAHHGNAAGPIRNRQMIEEGKPGTATSFIGRKKRRNNMLLHARTLYLEIIQG